MKVLLVEPYLGGSHRAWAEGYQRHSAHDVTIVGHAARFWKWRMHGGHLTLAEEIANVVGDDRSDVLVASSMTNLPALLGAARRSIGDAPTVLFMHENQLTYPLSPRDRSDATYPMINWTSMAVADLVVFNSEFHRSEWFAAIPTLLRSMPDYRHLHLLDQVAARSVVRPVGIDLARLDQVSPVRRHDGPPLVLWNQRAEHDKGPDEFADAVIAASAHADFRLALAGERFVSEPDGFDRLRNSVGDRIVYDGYADDDAYADLLRRSDVVVSTAHQEFFGIAVTEAVYAGAFPLLADRVVYPERIPGHLHDRCLFSGHDDLVTKLVDAVTDREATAAIAAELRPVMASCDWSTVAPDYDAMLAGLVTAE